ncbi:MAG: Gfo/Idh/MocA family oxidoreductase [Planctomycetota bacterium]
MKEIKIIIVGAGGRGTLFADYFFDNPGKAKVVAVAEPRQHWRNQMAQKHNIPIQNVFSDWKEIAKRRKFADAVLIATPDQMHVEPAKAFAKKGYHLLLEKPMAPTEQGCRQIVQAVTDNKILCVVCHCLRYTDYTRKLKEIIGAGAIGRLVSIQHLEPIGYWHFAHGFVRGSFANSEKSSCMLLQKSCHDLDWIRYIMGVPCIAVSSFGNLLHFQKLNKPDGAGNRCLDCPIESKCPYSAIKF